MKKKGLLLLALILVMTSSTVFAQNDITVRIDAREVEFNEEVGVPFIDESNHTLVPFRATLETFGADVEWDNAARTAKATKGDITIEVPIGEKYIVINGEKLDNDGVALINGSKTYLPISKVMEAFGTDVQWDQSLSTLVVTTEPFDAKSKIVDAYEKQYAWENYDMNMLMNISMTTPDETGVMQQIDMQMAMDATSFINPMRLKSNGNLIMDIEGNSFSQPIMEMYMVEEGNKLITYTGMIDPNTGGLAWIKQEVEGEGLSELVDPNNEEMKKLNAESIKEVNYLGTYSDNGKDLAKYEVTVSFEGFDQVIKQSMSMFSNSLSSDELAMSLNLVADLEDMTYIVYIDESNGEFTKMEIDLSTIVNSMFEKIINSTGIETEIPEGLTDEELEEFNNMVSEIMGKMEIKMDMVGEYLNINKAEDFKIPEEVLNAVPMEEYLEGLEKAALEVKDVQ